MAFQPLSSWGKKLKNPSPNAPKGNLPLYQQMAMVLHLFISDPFPGKGHIDAIYRALGRSKLFLKNASTLRNENTLEKRGRVNKAISCANPPPRSLDAMADSCCTGQTV